MLPNEKEVPTGDPKIIGLFKEGDSPHLLSSDRLLWTPTVENYLIRYDELRWEISEEDRAIYCEMRPKTGPNFTLGMLKEQLHLFQSLQHLSSIFNNSVDGFPLRYIIQTSSLPGVYNYGGDLRLFTHLIRQRDRRGLLEYAKLCVDCQFLIYNHFYLPVLSIAVVEGDALGGGFEMLLANDIIIAEKSAKFGMTEILFNLFPGMGAFSFLSRRLSPAQAEFMIFSGKTYEAQQLLDLGLVDLVVEDGTAIEATKNYLKILNRQFKTRREIYEIRRRHQPLPYDELLEITTRWVDSALSLSNLDLRRMEKLAHAQAKKWSPPVYLGDENSQI